MTVNIHGKEYKTVSERINEFRNDHFDWTILSEVLMDDGESALVKATIMNEEGRVISAGHGKEYRQTSKMHQTSYVEIAETSAVGRALAFYLYAGQEIASADEVASAIHAQNSMTGKKINIDKLTSVVDVAKQLVDEFESDLEQGAKPAREIYEPLSNDERMWVNGELNAKRLNKGTGKQHSYWAVFKQFLKAAA